MGKRIARALRVIVWLPLWLCCANAQSLRLATENYPPYNVVSADGATITGVSTEIVTELMRRSGETYALDAFPWARALFLAESDPDVCVFSTARTVRREPLFKWVGPIVKKYTWSIFARVDDNRHPSKLEDLRPYVIGSYRDGVAGQFLAYRGFKTDLSTFDTDNPNKLLNHRFDFWAAGKMHGLAVLKEQGLSDKIVPIFDFEHGEMYLACNINMADSRIDHLNQTFAAMEMDGTTSRIRAKYVDGATQK